MAGNTNTEHVMKLMPDHRRLQRFKMQLQARVSADGSENILECQTRDVSSGGAFFETAGALAPGTGVSVAMVLPIRQVYAPERREVLVKLTGEVTRATADGMAVMFSGRFDMSPRSEYAVIN